MVVSRVENDSFHYRSMAVDGIASKESQEQDLKKASLPAEYYVDTLNSVGHKGTVEKAVEGVPAVASTQISQKGWSSQDTLTTAVKPAETAGPSKSWLDWVGKTSNQAIDYVKGLFTSASTTVKETTTSTLDSIMESLHPKNVINGVTEMVKHVWSTITFADNAFADKNVDSVELPKFNADGTSNPFGGRRITREDYNELKVFQQDVDELLEHLTALQGDQDGEALLVELMKALAKGKKTEFESLKDKMQVNYKVRDAESKLRLEEAQKLIKKIEQNRWFDWFFEATQYTTLAFGAVVIGAATGGWGWPAVLLVMAGVGVANMAAGHLIEKGLAKVSAAATSVVTGANYARAAAKQTQYWKTAYGIGMSVAGLAIGFYQGSAQTAMKIVMGFGAVTRNVGTFRQTQLKHQTNKGEGEVEYHANILEEEEKTITASIKDLGKAYDSYAQLWAMPKGLIEGQTQELVSLFRNSSS